MGTGGYWNRSATSHIREYMAHTRMIGYIITRLPSTTTSPLLDAKKYTALHGFFKRHTGAHAALLQDIILCVIEKKGNRPLRTFGNMKIPPDDWEHHYGTSVRHYVTSTQRKASHNSPHVLRMPPCSTSTKAGRENAMRIDRSKKGGRQSYCIVSIGVLVSFNHLDSGSHFTGDGLCHCWNDGFSCGVWID